VKNRLGSTLVKMTGVCALVFTLATMAEATPILRMTSSAGGFVQITDNGAGDLDPTVGVVQFSGTLGTACWQCNYWLANLTIGSSYPVLGTSQAPHLDIQSINVSNSSAGTLLIEFTNDFDVDSQIFMSGNYGGLSGGIITYGLFGGVSAFSTTQTVFNGVVANGAGLYSGSFGASSFDPTTLGGFNAANNVWLTQRIQINHATKGGEVSDGSFSAQVPEPTTLLLLGAGLAGLGLLKRRSS
jgi:hypothetical protein